MTGSRFAYKHKPLSHVVFLNILATTKMLFIVVKEKTCDLQ